MLPNADTPDPDFGYYLISHSKDKNENIIETCRWASITDVMVMLEWYFAIANDSITLCSCHLFAILHTKEHQ